MKLKEGRYELPDGLRMYIEPGSRSKVLIVKKRVDRHIKPGDLRCKDCKHRGKGRSCPWKVYNGRFGDDICTKRVKKVVGDITYYYQAPYNKKPCELFEPIES